MAKNTNPYFHSGGAEGNVSLTTSAQTIVTGATDDSDIVVLSISNESANSSTLTVYDDASNVIGLINVPPSAGNSIGTPAVNILQPGFGMAGLEISPSGGYIYFLPATKTIKMKIDSVTGGARRVFWKRKDYAA